MRTYTNLYYVSVDTTLDSGALVNINFWKLLLGHRKKNDI